MTSERDRERWLPDRRLEPRAVYLIETLNLEPHPEGGFYRESFRASLELPASVLPHGGPRAASTAIYFLLPTGRFSAFHRVRSDEVWHHYEGRPVELHLLDASGGYRVAIVGKDLGTGARPHVVVPGGTLQAARSVGPGHVLCGCTVAPGFDFADFERPTRADLLARYPAQREIITALTFDEGGGG